MAFTKGAVDGLLDLVSRVWTAGTVEPMTADHRAHILGIAEDMAKQGVRVLGIAFRPLAGVPANPAQGLEQDLIFLGLVGMMDPPGGPPRPRSQMCRDGRDSPGHDHGRPRLDGRRHRSLPDDFGRPSGGFRHRAEQHERQRAAGHRGSHQRVCPSLAAGQAADRRRPAEERPRDRHDGRRRERFPGVKKADIGVAMGITGTDVAKEASAMVLLDDNFATIVAAVREGRVIFDNLLRFIKFSLGGNLGKVLVMLCAPLLGIALALRPLQLLWLNLLTDGLMGLGLGFEPAETDVMNRPPRTPNSPILDRATCVHIGWVGVLIGVLALGVGAAYFDRQDPADTTWQTDDLRHAGLLRRSAGAGAAGLGDSLFSRSPSIR